LQALPNSGKVSCGLVHFIREPFMKFNFWQMLGVALLVIGGGFLIYREMNKTPAPNPNPPASQSAK
jgi:hypothetical protein